MPVNNWIPVARDFTQYLDVQSQRRKKRIQQGIMQQLPQYISNELSNTKTKEDIYRKLPELSAQMFAIDPEIGAQATQLANQYGQMKLNQIQEAEVEETSKRGLSTLKDTFGNVNVMHKGKVTPFANVLDEITPSMRSEDALKFGETILKAGQVKRKAISDFTKGKPTLSVYQMLNGEVVDKPKQYFIDRKNRTLDDMSTKDIESLSMGIEETEDLAKFEMNEYERQQNLKKQKEYSGFIHGLNKSEQLNKRVPVNVTLDGKPQLVMAGNREMERPDPNNPDKKIKVMEQRFFDDKGTDITDKIDISKVYASQFNEPDWNDYRKQANDVAEQFITQYAERAGILDDSRIEDTFGKSKFQLFKNTNRDRKQLGYATDILEGLTKTTHENYHGPSGDENALVREIAAKLGLWDPFNGIAEGKESEYKDLWWKWQQFKQFNQLRNQKGPVQQNTQSIQKKGAYD